MRFCAALSVATFHYSHLQTGIAYLLPFGWVGVEVFFVISGLVIANSAYGATPRSFLISRFLRLYPAAWCAALIGFPLLIAFKKMEPGGPLRLLNALVLFLPGDGLSHAYWTLPIEIAFYFLIYLLLRSGRFERNIQWIPRFLILWSAPYVMLAWFQHRGLLHSALLELSPGRRNIFLFRHGIYFGAGMLVWLMKEGKLNRIGYCFLGASVLLGTLEIDSNALVPALDLHLMVYGLPVSGSSLSGLSIGAFLLAFAVVFLSAKWNRWFPKNEQLRKAVRCIGLVSYPLYLSHETVFRLLSPICAHRLRNPIAGVLMMLFCALCISLAISSWAEPLLRLQLKKILHPRSKNALAVHS
jgi:peptidoglycan/LPS O-acetylase OafA/YrhL